MTALVPRMAPAAATQTTSLLRVQNLGMGFRSRHGLVRAIDGVDLEVGPGRTLCLVGESGSGKSVTARSIMRLMDDVGVVDAGSRILFDGQDILALDEPAMRRLRGASIAMVFQEPMSALNPVQTVGEQIAEPLVIHGLADRAEARRRAVEMMAMVGIPAPAERMGVFPHQMSGGMLQRVVIAMALICRPRLLIADEPTTALDVTVQAQILDLLQQLQRDLGMALMLITHDLGIAWEIADDIAVMYAGQIVEHGAVPQVLGRPAHPYTAALLRSVPALGIGQDQPLHDIPGTVPSPRDWAPGCRFSDRCTRARPDCAALPPPVAEARGRLVRCWLPLAEDGR